MNTASYSAKIKQDVSASILNGLYINIPPSDSSQNNPLLHQYAGLNLMKSLFSEVKQHPSDDFPTNHSPTADDWEQPLSTYLRVDKPAPNIIANIQKLLENFQQLKLKCRQISPSGYKIFCQALKTNQSITRLVFSNIGLHNSSHHGTVDNPLFVSLEGGAIALAKALKVNKSIAKLDFSRNNVRNNGAIALAEGLKKNSSLTQLDLSENWISDAGAIALADALKKNSNSSLTQLNLRSNMISFIGVIALAKALKDHSSILELDLSNNCCISAEGICALTTLLKSRAFLLIKCHLLRTLSENIQEAFKQALNENKENRLCAQREYKEQLSKAIEGTTQISSVLNSIVIDYVDLEDSVYLQYLFNIEKLKTTMINKFIHYSSSDWYKFRLFVPGIGNFGPSHKQLVAAAIQALRKAKTKKTIEEILINQKAQLDSQNVETKQLNPPHAVSPDNKSEASRFFQPGKLRNKEKGEYYQTIIESLALLEKEETPTSTRDS